MLSVLCTHRKVDSFAGSSFVTYSIDALNKNHVRVECKLSLWNHHPIYQASYKLTKRSEMAKANKVLVQRTINTLIQVHLYPAVGRRHRSLGFFLSVTLLLSQRPAQLLPTAD